MPKNIHPKLSTLTIECTNGDKYQVKWTGKTEEMQLHSDPFNHPAWTGETKLNVNTGRAAAFMSKMKKQ